MSEHKNGALYHQYDSNFHNMIGYMLRLDGSVKDDKKLDALLGTRVVMWAIHFNPVELWICCKIAKLAGLISKARAGQSACCLSKFFQWPMMSSSVCPLSKSRKWREQCTRFLSIPVNIDPVQCCKMVYNHAKILPKIMMLCCHPLPCLPLGPEAGLLATECLAYPAVCLCNYCQACSSHPPGSSKGVLTSVQQVNHTRACGNLVKATFNLQYVLPRYVGHNTWAQHDLKFPWSCGNNTGKWNVLSGLNCAFRLGKQFHWWSCFWVQGWSCNHCNVQQSLHRLFFCIVSLQSYAHW